LARKILLADDSVTAQNMGRKILTDAGYEVVTVNNGSAALKKIFEVKPDLIVLDVYMPGYSGLEVCQRIKENRDSARIPVLLTVGKLEPFKPEEARRVRADAFVVKPFEASELLAALARLEDKIVPQPEPYKQGRFAKAVAAVDDQVAVDKDETWKNRLRIPTHESHPEPQPEPEPEVPVPSKVLRALHAEDSGKHEARREGVFERPIPAGVPADITPEEIAAIAAAAAQLKAGAPGQVAEPVERAAEPVELVPASTASAPVTAESTSEEASPVTFASAPETHAAAVGLSLAETGEPKSVEESEPELATAAVAPQPESAEVPAAAETQPAEAVAEFQVAQGEETSQVADAPVSTSEVAATAPETSEIAPVEAASVSESAPLDAPAEVASAPAPQPPDDEVMAALQSLMPADISSETMPVTPTQTPSIDTASSAMAAIVAQVDSGSVTAHAPGPRWIAEEVALSDEEATLSLEREMEVAYAAVGSSGVVLAASAVVATSPAAPAEITTPERYADTPAENVATESAAYAMAAGATESASVAAPTPEHVAPAEITAIHAEEITASAAPASAPSEPSEAAAVADDSNLPDSQTSGGLEDMAASWKNIRDSIATGSGAKAAPAKEKEEFSPAEPATPESSAPETRASAASDPKAIASIVDSVLAELRPKIVEEIAKKLADSKKD
jgi:twitching motility two-component system response regulator PilH